MTIKVKREIPLTVLLTGSVLQNHPTLTKTGLQNPHDRLLDYFCAIPRWIAQPEVDHVVYCDAGGFRIPQELFNSPKFESLTLDLKDLCVERGKGTSESTSMEYAMTHSTVLKEGFFKCTGRLFVENFSEVLKEIIPLKPCFYLSKDHDMQWADTRFFWLDRACYETSVRPHLDKMNDFNGRIAEFIYYYHGQEYRPLPNYRIVGRSGHTGQYYDKDYSEEEKERARELIKNIDLNF